MLYRSKCKELLQLGGWIEDKKTAVCNMAESYLKLDKREEMAQCIIESLQWSIPKADTICKLALYFFEKEEYQTAIFWYQAALKAKPTDDSLALTRSDFYTWIPAIQICVCYCKLGEYVKAYYYNELTKVLGGNIEKVNHNQKYIKEQLVRLNQKVPDIQINFTAI